MRSVLSTLFLLLTICSVFAGSTTAEMNNPSEGLQSPPTQWQKIMAQRYANSSSNYRMAYEPHQYLPPDLQVLRKRERIRKAISMIGYVFIVFATTVFASLGGSALNKKLGGEGRKKGIKWIVLAFLSTVLAIYWIDLVTIAMSLSTG
jgi:hypothetical protein